MANKNEVVGTILSQRNIFAPYTPSRMTCDFIILQRENDSSISIKHHLRLPYEGVTSAKTKLPYNPKTGFVFGPCIFRLRSPKEVAAMTGESVPAARKRQERLLNEPAFTPEDLKDFLEPLHNCGAEPVKQAA